MKFKLRKTAALTLVEWLIIMGVLVLLTFLFLPRTTGNKARAPRIVCINNLKQVDLAYLLWANDHSDQFPFAATNHSGTRAFVHSPEVFRHYLVLSNELVSPKILACPEDRKRKRANDFSKLSNGSLSYFVGLDARKEEPSQILSGDRNITGGTLSNGFLRVLAKGAQVGWSKHIHQSQGNIGFADGSVQQVTPARLTKHLAALTNTTVRLAIP